LIEEMHDGNHFIVWVFCFFHSGVCEHGVEKQYPVWAMIQGLKIEKVEIRVLPTRPVVPLKDEKLSAECTQSKLVKIT
jgi:hypothetical protein